MRQFRTCTDSVFDLDSDADDPRDLALVTQAGPPPQEVTDPPAVGSPAVAAT
jgi:hypothetical protein